MNQITYLSELLKAFKTKSIPNKYFIVGNTTCDIDSVLCAYILSIGKNLRHGCIKIDDSGIPSIVDESKEIYLPVINCQRGEYKTRLEGQNIFKKFKIKEEDFLYMNDPELQEKALIEGNNDKQTTNIILVDHSILDINQKYFANYVVEVYDHHMNLYLDYPHLINKSIKYPCGSCTTLILVDYYLSNFPHCLISPQLAVTAILLDTENFKDIYYGNRWSEIDKMTYNHIINQIQSQVDMNEFYNQVFKAKFDLQENLALGLEALFTKDRKKFMWNKILVERSSFQVSIFKLIEHFGKDNVVDYCNTFKGKVEFYIMNSSIDNGGKVFIIYSFDNFKGMDLKKFEEYIRKAKTKCLRDFRVAKEGNIIEIEFDSSQTRKVIEPLMNTYFQENPIDENIFN